MAGTGNGEGMTAGGTGLTGRVVVVTGGASAIGAQLVAGLADAGARVIAADLAEQAREGPGPAAYYQTDITDDAALGQMVDRTVADFGGIDALVNCAAVYKTLGGKVSLTEITNAEWDRVLTVNVRGTWQAIKAVIPAIARRGGGHVVNISSSTARKGTPGFAHYVASKAAVEGLTRAAARELGAKGITVNAIAPGLVDDDATNVLNDRGYVEQAAGRRAIPRQMYPSDLVGAAQFLASDASSFITGQVLIVDGGSVFV